MNGWEFLHAHNDGLAWLWIVTLLTLLGCSAFKHGGRG